MLRSLIVAVALSLATFAFAQNQPPSDPQAVSYAAKLIAALTGGTGINDGMRPLLGVASSQLARISPCSVATAPFATRLTQSNKCAAKGKTATALRCSPAPQLPNICLGRGRTWRGGVRIALSVRLRSHEQRWWKLRKQGRIASKTPESRARLATTQRRQQSARWSWNPSSQPDWLTDDFYKDQIQPRLIKATLSQIASAIGVSIMYASDIRRGRRKPHPRHWNELARLTGVIG